MPWSPTRCFSVPSARSPWVHRVRAVPSSSCQATGARLTGAVPSPRSSVAVPPSSSARYFPPLHDDSPVHADSGVTTVPVVSVAASASTTRSPSRLTTEVSAVACVRTAGWASSASIVSSPWIVLSAPLFGLIRPSASSPSNVTPVFGSYIAFPDRFAPKNHAASSAARSRAARRAARVAHREQRLHAGVDAVRDLHRLDRRRQPAVVRAAAGQQRRVEADRLGHRGLQQRRLAQHLRARGQGRRLLRAPGVPVGPRLRPGQHRAVRPARPRRSPSPRCPRASLRSASRARSSLFAAPTYALSPSTASALASAPSHDQPGRDLHAVGLLVVAVAGEHVVVQRADRRAGSGRAGTSRTPGPRRLNAAYPSPYAHRLRACQ